MQHARRILAAAALVGCGMSVAYGVDQTILGDTLQVKNPSSPDKRKVVCKGKEKASSNTLVGDPTILGASLQIRANGGTPSGQLFYLGNGNSPSTGKPFWSGDSVKGWKYKDPKYDNGPIKALTIKKSQSGTFQIKATALGKASPLIVLPPDPGTDGCMVLQIFGGDTYSVAFRPLDGTITNKGPLEYKHRKPSWEGVCTTTTINTMIPTTSTSTTLVPTTTTSSTATPTTTTSTTAAPTTTTSTTAAPTTTTSTTLCSNQVFNFSVGAHNDTSIFDDIDLSDEWLGGSETQFQSGACSVTVAKPSGNIDLVGTLGSKWSVSGFAGFSNCFGFGGEDGDGCQVPSCDAPAAIGFCQDTRPSCTSALGGGGSSGGFQVQCLQ